MQHVHIVETYISPCEKRFVGFNVRTVPGGRRHLRGGHGVAVMNTECFLEAPKSSLFISEVNINVPTAGHTQSPKNLGGRVALPSRKFLRVRKVFARNP